MHIWCIIIITIILTIFIDMVTIFILTLNHIVFFLVRGWLCLFGFGFFVDFGDFFGLEELIYPLCVYCKLGP